jgi:hypothetical protein
MSSLGTRGRGVIAAALVAAAALSVTAQASPATSAGRTAAVTAAPTGHPAHNVAPKPQYAADCAHGRSNSAACIKHALAAINRARSLEHVRPMILPGNFTKLTFAEQTFVVTDLERVDRGLAPFRGLTAKLNRTAKAAAVADVDPVPATSTIGRVVVQDYASNWTSNFGPLAGDYGWMYDDGYGSYNIDCPARSAPGCWGHRDIILDTYGHKPMLISGVGCDPQSGLLSIAQLFVAGKGKAPRFTYSWAKAVAHGAGGRHR